MKKWMVKTAVQHVIGRLPKSYKWNGIIQKYVYNSYYPSRDTFRSKLELCQQHLNYYNKFSPSPKTDFTALELGIGPWPVISIGFYLSGAHKTWAFDIAPLLQNDNLKRILELYIEFSETGELQTILKNIQPEKLNYLKSVLFEMKDENPADVMKKFNINLIICDARKTELQDKSVDLIFSTLVYGHIEAKILHGLLLEFKRVAKDDSVINCFTFLNDQYSSFDKSISQFNFYKYSDWQWKFFNNPIIPQGRLRLSDFRKLYNETGWNIVEERNTLAPVEDIKKINLAPKFQNYMAEELRVTFSWLIAKPFMIIKIFCHNIEAYILDELMISFYLEPLAICYI